MSGNVDHRGRYVFPVVYLSNLASSSSTTQYKRVPFTNKQMCIIVYQNIVCEAIRLRTNGTDVREYQMRKIMSLVSSKLTVYLKYLMGSISAKKDFVFNQNVLIV